MKSAVRLPTAMDGPMVLPGCIGDPDINKITHPLNPRTRVFWNIQPLTKVKRER